MWRLSPSWISPYVDCDHCSISTDHNYPRPKYQRNRALHGWVIIAISVLKISRPPPPPPRVTLESLCAFCSPILQCNHIQKFHRNPSIYGWIIAISRLKIWLVCHHRFHWMLISQFCGLCGLIIHPCTKSQQNLTICSWFIDDFTNFPGPFFWSWSVNRGSPGTAYFDSPTPICLFITQLSWGYDDD